MKAFAYMPGLSLAEFADINLIYSALRLNVFTSLSTHIRKYFSHPKLIALMEFPVLVPGRYAPGYAGAVQSDELCRH